ncbi:MAG: hypothetical protein U9O20_01410 [Patescibacteria group bacterium]|nr:hypothetical protein [Patescibacteria group bacterium]
MSSIIISCMFVLVAIGLLMWGRNWSSSGGLSVLDRIKRLGSFVRVPSFIKKLSPIRIINLFIVAGSGVIFFGGVAYILSDVGGVDLFDATEKAAQRALGSKPAAQTTPEVQIDLANLFDLSQERRMLTLNCRYQKVILTSDLKIQATGGKTYALFGSEDTGIAKVKLANLGYQKVEGRLERTNTFLVLRRGSIIDFLEGDRTINFVASGGHKVYLVPKTQGASIVFSYKEFKGPV